VSPIQLSGSGWGLKLAQFFLNASVSEASTSRYFNVTAVQKSLSILFVAPIDLALLPIAATIRGHVRNAAASAAILLMKQRRFLCAF